MARKQPPRMLPPSQTPRPLGADDPAFEANAEIVMDLLQVHGERIHWWHNVEGSACAASIDFSDGPPLSVLMPVREPRGSTADLVRSLHLWVAVRDRAWGGLFRLEFERQLAESRPEMLAAVRGQLDVAYERQDGPPVVAILPGHIIVATCIDRIGAN